MAGLENTNHTSITEFLLLGFETPSELEMVLFIAFFIIYVATMSGNILLVLTVWTDYHLHTPMYFFLSSLSFLEAGFSSYIIPCLLVSLATGNKTISFLGYFVQLLICSCLGGTECLLLAGMSYDRYLAICHPLHYASYMNSRSAFLVAFASWAVGFVVPSCTVIMTFLLPFFGPCEINHFFSDLTAVLKLSCADTRSAELVGMVTAAVILLATFILTVTSYVYFILAMLWIQSTMGRKKAFSTCTSHLIVVSTFYGVLIFMYMMPSRKNSLDFKNIFSLIYTVVTLMFSPIVYSLRNAEVKDALKRAVRKMWLSPKN